jgi:hypothetical protein
MANLECRAVIEGSVSNAASIFQAEIELVMPSSVTLSG